MIKGLDPNVPVETNENGGKQSATPYGFHLLPVSSVFAAAEVAAYGANKYGETFSDRNYIKIPVEEHINHAIQHLYGYLAGDTSDDHLGHAIVRAMFAYDVAKRAKEEVVKTVDLRDIADLADQWSNVPAFDPYKWKMPVTPNDVPGVVLCDCTAHNHNTTGGS